MQDTHGRTYTEAVKNALEVIELWIEDAQKSGEPELDPLSFNQINA